MTSRALKDFATVGRKILAIGRNYVAGAQSIISDNKKHVFLPVAVEAARKLKQTAAASSAAAVCITREHAKELHNPIPKEPVVFMKPPTAYITEGQLIRMPPGCTELHHEVELGIVIGKGGSRIPESQAMEHIGGYTLALDMTDRAKQMELKGKGLPWDLSKGFDTSCPVGEFIAKTEVPDPHDLQLWLKVNDEVRQDANTKDMIFRIPFLISHLSQYFTLEEGDLILTGTPEGVGPVKPGDQIECGIGKDRQMVFKVEQK